MPESYLEGYAPAEIARHVRMISRLSPEQPVEVEVRSLGGQSYEICVVGFDRTGVLAAITTALASDGLDTQDLRLATYAHDEDDDARCGLFRRRRSGLVRSAEGGPSPKWPRSCASD